MLRNTVTHLLIEDDKGIPEVVPLTVKVIQSERNQIDVEFMYRFIKFKFNFESRRFEPVVFDCIEKPEILKSKYGKGIQTEKEVQRNQQLFGKCMIDVPKRPMYTILIDEVLTPFHLFQYANIWLLIKEDFYSYACLIAVITGMSIFIEIKENLSNY